MDEVLAVGDALFQQKCLLELRKLKRMGKTIILVSHSEQHMRDFADRVLVLGQGMIKTIDQSDRALFVYNNMLLNYREGGNEEKDKDPVNSGENQIVSIRIENQNSIGTSIFENGDTIRFIIQYNITNISKQMHIGFGIIDKLSSVWICGNNTYHDGVLLEMAKWYKYGEFVVS